MRISKLSTISLFLFSLALFVSAGFLGYYFGFLGFIYKIMLPNSLREFSLVGLSIIFGVASFFSPCAFTVLPSYVSHYLTQEAGAKKSTIGKGLYFGLLAALGVISVNIALGVIIAALGATTPFTKDPRQDLPLILGIRVFAGFLITYLGLLTFLGKSFEIPFIGKLVDKASFGKGIFLYGVIYNLASIGCTGPILLGLILYALSLGSFVGALTSFTVFATTMGVLMIAFTLLLTIVKEGLIRKIAPFTPIIQKIAGVVMLLAGLTVSLLTLEGNRLFVKIFFPFLK